MRKPPGGGGGFLGLWIGCLVCKRHTCKQVCYLLKSASPGKGSPSSVDKALDVKASEFKKCLIYQAKLNVYVIVIIIKPTCIGKKIDEIMFKEGKKI